MTGSPARPLLLAALLLAAHSAAAQVGPPIRLQPGASPAPIQLPPPQPPGQKAPPMRPAEPLGQAAPPMAPTVSARPLSLGRGGDPVFGTDQWNGTSLAVAEALLRRLPAAIPSPTLHGIAHRLLVAPATPPAGNGSEGEMLALRLDKLDQMGEPDAAGEILASLPQNDPSLQQARLDQLWLDGKDDDACALSKQLLGRTPTTLLQQSQIACATLAGDRDGAALGLQVLREQKADDATFDSLLDIANDIAGAALPKSPNWTPINLGLAQALKSGLPPDMLRSTDPSVLRMLALSQDTQKLVRLAAAERAAIVGAFPPSALARLYQQTEFSVAEKTDPITAAHADDGPRGRALLYVAIQIETSPIQRAELLRMALDSAFRSGGFTVAATLYEPLLMDLAPGPELMRMALPVGQSLSLTGDVERVKAWYQMARQNGGSDGGVAASRLWVLGRLAAGDDFAPLDSDALSGWTEMQQRRDATAAPARLTLLLALIEGLGDTAPGTAWGPLVAGGKSSLPAQPIDAVLSAEMHSAAADAREGEAASLALIAIGARLPGPESALAAYDALTALRFIGLDREAHMLAVEIAIANGL